MKHLARAQRFFRSTTGKVFTSFVVVNGLLWSWLWLVSVGQLAQQRGVGYLSITIAFTVIVGISSTVFTISAKYLWRLYKQQTGWRWILTAVAVWAFSEALAGWLVAFVWFGQNGSIDNVMPFSSLTPFLMYTPVRFLSRFVGYYGVSAVMVTGIAVIALKKTRKHAITYWGIVFVVTVLGWAFYKTPDGQATKTTIVAETLEQKLPVKTNGSTLVVLPEYGLDDSLPTDKSQRFSPTKDTYYYVGSKQTPVRNGHTNVLIFGNSQKGNVQYQPKNRLIAGGEHLPFWGEMIMYVFFSSTLSDFQARREVVRGDKPIQPYRINQNLVVGAEVCSSIMSTRDYRQLTKKGSTVLTNSASLEIFEGSRLFRWQQRGLGTFMATANARPFLQSTNHWPAYVVNQNGDYIAQTVPVSQLQANITPNRRKTLYTYLGEWLAVVGGACVLYDYVQKRLKRRILNQKKRKS